MYMPSSLTNNTDRYVLIYVSRLFLRQTHKLKSKVSVGNEAEGRMEWRVT